MPETQKASTGWNGEVWISTDDTVGNLAELVEVRSFTTGNPTADRVETTHLKSPGRRRTYTAGMIDSGEASIVINARRGSDTYTLVRGALNGGDERYTRFNYPEIGTLTWTQDVMGVVTAVDEGEVSADGNMELTITLSINTVVADTAYTAP